METSLGMAALGFVMIALHFAQKSRLARIEQKLNALMRNQGIDAAGQLGLSERVKELARNPNQKIEAIKLLREETGVGLVEAKQTIEAYINSL